MKYLILFILTSTIFSGCLTTYKSDMAVTDGITGLISLKHASEPIWHAKLRSNYRSGNPRVITEVCRGLIKNAWSFGPDGALRAGVFDYAGEIRPLREDGSVYSSIEVRDGRQVSIVYFDKEGNVDRRREHPPNK